MRKLKEKVAVITGGNSGIGLASAKAFAAEGAKIAIIGRDRKTLDLAKKELGSSALMIQVDVSNLSELDMAYSEIKKNFGHIDILFANAGVAKFTPFNEVSEQFYDQIMDINVKGLFFTVQKALPLMAKGGSIILTSSSLNSRAIPGGSVYGASKAAVRSLGRGFAADLADKGIRVNVLSPGPVETPIFERLGLSETQLKSMGEAMAARVPLKRFGQSEEIAKAALFLASDDSSFVFGSEISVDGGIAQL